MRLPISGASPLVWRSLEEFAGVTAQPEISGHEFLERVDEWLDGPSRRDFLRVSAASLALAGLGGCAYQPAESIVPYVEAPEEVIPGRPLFFASAVPIDGFACGVLVKSEMGRPIKIEGNPAHPASLGATDMFRPGHDPGTVRPRPVSAVTRGGRIETWEHFQSLALGLRRSPPLEKRRRPAHPDPDGRLAHPGRSAAPALRRIPASQMACLRADLRATPSAPAPGWLSAKTSNRFIISRKPT